MSLMWYDPFDFTRSSRLLNQRFGLMLQPEDLLQPAVPAEFNRLLGWPNYYRPWTSPAAEQDAGSSISTDKDKFQVNLDVQQFKPNEITVKVSDNMVTVEGKHEERPDEHGFISRQFVRKYILPEDVNISKAQSSLSSDGVLTISAPKKEAVESKDREIQIIQTGQPTKTVPQKSQERSESKPGEKNIEIQKETRNELESKSGERNIEIQKEARNEPESKPGERNIEIQNEARNEPEEKSVEIQKEPEKKSEEKVVEIQMEAEKKSEEKIIEIKKEEKPEAPAGEKKEE